MAGRRSLYRPWLGFADGVLFGSVVAAHILSGLVPLPSSSASATAVPPVAPALMALVVVVASVAVRSPGWKRNICQTQIFLTVLFDLALRYTNLKVKKKRQRLQDLIKMPLWFPTISSHTLTLCADDAGSFPGAVGPAAGSRDVALEEALGALVADHSVDVIVGPSPTHQMGIVHHWRGSAQHCRIQINNNHLIMLSNISN